MGVIRLPDWNDHFSNHEFLGSFVNKVFSRDRFFNLSCFLHFYNDNNRYDNNNISTLQNSKLLKIKNLLDIIQKFKIYYNPTQQLSVDETVIPFQKRTHFLTYNKDKPEQWGIKAFTLCDSKGYVLNVIIYCGANTIPIPKNSCFTTQIVLQLLKGIKNKQYIIFTDNYYTNFELLYILQRSNIGLCGVLKNKRKHLPKSIKDMSVNELEKGKIMSYSNNLCIVTLFSDKKIVKILHNVYSNLKIETAKDKPQCIVQYNKYRSGVDLANQESSYYRYLHKTRKWWKPIFIQCFEFVINNIYNLYQDPKNKGKKLSYKLFRLNIAEELINNFTARKKAGRPKKTES